MELISNFGTVLSQDMRQELANNDTCSVRSSHSPANGAMNVSVSIICELFHMNYSI